jgi:hypothetical protein
MRRDIQSTIFPEQISRDKPPRNLGSKRHGTLKAAQWRSVYCFTLLTTLARHWGSLDAPTKYRGMFENYMHLAIVIRIAYSRSITPSMIDEFEHHSRAYIHGLRNIFPLEYFKPSHHYFLHLGQFMRRFGPIPGWWAFAFERYNGFVQRTKTNNKPGQLFLTLGSYLTRI